MLMGVPTIATYAGGIPSIIENNKEGILVQDGDPFAMAGAIFELIDNPDKCNLFSTNSKLKAKARHNPKEILSKTIAIYKAIIEE
jgi:glycosyltransferase involved in cell wall biosynthesis